MNNNAIITSVLARCTVEPDFLQLILGNPELALQQYRTKAPVYEELLQFDFSRMLKFAGFVTKVKNNNTWQQFQYTRVAMGLFQLESAFFIDYYPHFSEFKSSGEGNYEVRLDHFYGHARKFLEDKKAKEASLCLSLLDHEQAIRTINKQIQEFSKNDSGIKTSTKVSPESLVHLSPAVLLRKDTFIPTQLIRMLGDPDGLKKVEAGQYWLLYHMVEGDLQITNQQTWVAFALSLINGKRSVQRIEEIMCDTFGEENLNGAVRPFFEDLAEEKVVYLSGGD